MNILLWSVLCLLSVHCAKGDRLEVLWDTWGVPHIYGRETRDVFYGFGWSQMRSHGDVILRAYGEARGRASEYWGESYLESDKIIHTVGLPALSREWLEDQGSDYRLFLEAFVQGMNDYADSHAGEIFKDVKIVLPVKPVDVIAHLQRTWHLLFLAGNNFNSARAWGERGSNAWAIGPERSASGKAMLLANPHLYWTGFLMFYEAHLIGPGLDAYGATILGMPFLVMGFNNDIGWTNTVNTIDGADLYQLTLREGGYILDGELKNFETEEVTLEIKEADGSMRRGGMTVLRSVHGPVIAQEGDRALAVRISGLDQPGMIEQMWDIMRAGNLKQFEGAVSRLQVPLLNFLYADRDGHILYVFGGRTPERSVGDWNTWSGIVPGDTSSNIWRETLDYDSLPRVLDPPSGWLQSTNDPPWFCTFPRELDPTAFPPYLSPQFLHLRAQRSVKMLMADDRITFDEFISYKFSTLVELAERILDDLLPIARKSQETELLRAADILENWDKHVDAESRGAVLFYFWVNELGGNLFARPWDPDRPLITPDGLSDPQAAVEALKRASTRVEETYGGMDVPWGEVFRLRYAGKDLPASGGPGQLGIFNVLTFVPDPDRKFSPRHGEGFIAAIEFGDRVRAQALLTYGNATQPGSPHGGDQLELFSQKMLRDVWLGREEIEQHLESRDILDWTP